MNFCKRLIYYLFPSYFINNEIRNTVRSLDIVIISRNSCPWCIRTLEFCQDHNILDLITIVDFNSTEAQKLMDQYSVKVKAVPTWISRTTGKHKIGHTDCISDVLNELYITDHSSKCKCEKHKHFKELDLVKPF